MNNIRQIITLKSYYINIKEIYGRCPKNEIYVCNWNKKIKKCDNCKLLLCKRHVRFDHKKCIYCDNIKLCMICNEIPESKKYYYCPKCINICCGFCMFYKGHDFMCSKCIKFQQ